MGFGSFIKYIIISIITISLLSGCNNINFSNIENNIEACPVILETDEKNITINPDDGCPEVINENNKNINDESLKIYNKDDNLDKNLDNKIKKEEIHENTLINYNNKLDQIKIATCPTFQRFFENTNFSLTKTNTTSQSFSLLENGHVNYIIWWRKAKWWEYYQDYKILGQGYSFLAKQSTIIWSQELQTINFYTDLDDVESIKEIFWIKNLEKVENIYNYIDQNIIITSRENTDYTRWDIIHVLHPNWERYIQSRIPILYCRNICEKDVINIIKNNLQIN